MKAEKEDEHEAPYKPSIYMYICVFLYVILEADVCNWLTHS